MAPKTSDMQCRIRDLLVKSMFADMGTSLPACNRWYTFSPHLARQTCALYTHGILRRVLSQAYSKHSAPQGEVDPDDFHSMSHQRHLSSLDFVKDQPSTASLMGVALVVGAPMDRLSFRLQHLDFVGNSLTELVDTSSSGLLLRITVGFYMGQLGLL